MKESFQLPPIWCSSMCRNAMNEICVKNCAIKRDCSGFDPKPELTLADMPRFPKTNGMSREEKFTSVTIYLSKVVDHLQGVEHEPESRPAFPRVSRVSRLLVERKVIAAVAESLQDAQNDPVGAETDKLVHQPTETTSDGLAASESTTSKENE
ncbi:MAG: hypothetical protein IH589_08765 [Anaerolineales bacterium]|nr:hypothetical protein [Anaerolineales bacterium]